MSLFKNIPIYYEMKNKYQLFKYLRKMALYIATWKHL